MNARLRTALLLSFAVSGLLLAACDSDDPAETDHVRFDGVFASSTARAPLP